MLHGNTSPNATAKIQNKFCFCKSLKLSWLAFSCIFNIPQLCNEITQIREKSYVVSGIKFPNIRNKTGNFVNGSKNVSKSPLGLKNHFQKSKIWV